MTPCLSFSRPHSVLDVGFSAHYVGQDHGFVMTWYDANGDPVRQEGQISAIETDTNDSTGASVVVRTQLLVHVDMDRPQLGYKRVDRKIHSSNRIPATAPASLHPVKVPGGSVVRRSVGRRG